MEMKNVNAKEREKKREREGKKSHCYDYAAVRVKFQIFLIHKF